MCVTDMLPFCPFFVIFLIHDKIISLSFETNDRHLYNILRGDFALRKLIFLQNSHFEPKNRTKKTPPEEGLAAFRKNANIVFIVRIFKEAA